MPYESKEEIAEFTKNYITSASVRQALFGQTRLNSYDIVSSLMKRIMLLTSSVAYLLWRNTHPQKHQTSKHQQRIFDVFSTVYRNRTMSFEIAIFVMVEMKKDIDLLGEQSFFRPILGANVNKKFSRLYDVIQESEINIGIADSQDFLTNYMDVLQECEYLKELDFTIIKKTDSLTYISVSIGEITFDTANVLALLPKYNELALLTSTDYLSSNIFEHHYISLYNLSKHEIIEKEMM